MKIPHVVAKLSSGSPPPQVMSCMGTRHEVWIATTWIPAIFSLTQNLRKLFCIINAPNICAIGKSTLSLRSMNYLCSHLRKMGYKHVEPKPDPSNLNRNKKYSSSHAVFWKLTITWNYSLAFEWREAIWPHFIAHCTGNGGCGTVLRTQHLREVFFCTAA